MQSGLGKVGRVADGTNYGYTELVCRKQAINYLFDVPKIYEHIRIVDLSDNLI